MATARETLYLNNDVEELCYGGLISGFHMRTSKRRNIRETVAAEVRRFPGFALSSFR